MHKKLIFLIAAATLISSAAGAQSVGVSTNALGWGALTPNIGVDVGLARHFTFEVDAGINPFTYQDDRSSKFWAVQPEFKYWPVEKFRGPSIGIHGTYGMYDFGMKRYIYQGSMYGGGLSLNYAWMLGERWNLEAGVGGGLTRLDQTNMYERKDIYSCYGPDMINKWGLTKAGITFTYLFGRTSGSRKAALAQRAERRVARQADRHPWRYFYEYMNDAGRLAAGRVDTIYVIKEAEPKESAPVEYVEVEEQKTFNVTFPVGSATPQGGNLREIANYLFDPSLTSYSVRLVAGCSPEGGESMNDELARNRAESVLNMLRSLGVGSQDISRNIKGADWEKFYELVSEFQLRNGSAIKRIISEGNDRSAALNKIRNTYPEDWKVITSEIFPLLRTVDVEVKALRKTEKK